MTDDEFEKRVRDLVQREGMLEGEARIRVSLEAGEGGDVQGVPEINDPVALLDQLGDAWKPNPAK